MTKEMYVSSTPHETKVAVVEDDQLAEIFFERENEYTLAGSIYKGRVTRVLPGMQSAFVDIGLERDAFLYVSDFLDLAEEEEEEFEAVPTRPETYVTNKPQPEPRHYEFQKEFQKPEPVQQRQAQPSRTVEPEESADEAYTELSDGGDNGPEGGEENGRGGFRGRRRRRGRRGRGFPESKFARGPQREEASPELDIAEDFGPPSGYEPVLLPGESISKYRRNEPVAPAVSSVHESDDSDLDDGADLGSRETPGEASFVIEGGFDAPDALTEFAEPEGPARADLAAEALKAPEPERTRPVPASVPTPFVLPGESIAKYKPVGREALEEKVAEEADEAVVSELAKPPQPVIETEPATKEPEPPAPRVSASISMSYTGPIILPGEKIAKYQPKPEAKQVAEQPAQPAEQQEPPAESKGGSELAGPSPANDAGEEAAEEPAAVDEQPAPERRKKRQEGPRTEVRMEGRNPVAPFVLPGESIAKYRRTTDSSQSGGASTGTIEEEAFSPDTIAEHVGEAEATTPNVASESSEAVPAVAEHGSVGGTVEPAPEAEHNIQEPEAKYEEMNVASTFGQAAELPHDAAKVEQSAEEHPEAADGSAQESEEQGRLESMNLANTFGGEAVEHEQDVVAQEHEEEFAAEHESSVGEKQDGEESVAAEQEQAAVLYETVEQRHRYSADAGHTLEEEEIEEDESDYEILAEEEDESDFVEMEEHTLNADDDERGVSGIAGGNEIDEANGLTEVVVDALLDEETSASAYPEATVIDEGAVEGEAPDDLDEDEFEESELEADVEEEAAPGQVAATAYPQRPARPGYDRRPGRGRRGGRRMRGGPRREAPRAIPQISELLKEGQEVLIQIAKEPIGKKGARITSHIALPGRYLVYMPTVNHIGVSRKINSDEERQRLKRIMLSEREGGHGGFIVRTAAEGITEEELRADIRFLKNLWHDIKTRSDNSKAPALIYHDLNLVERVLRDQVTADFSSIWVDNEVEYERILRFAQRFQPQLVRKVKLYTKSTPLYEQFGIREEIDKALKSKVWLKSGGYIVINQTEALVAIDVNTGKYVGKTTRLEDTIVKTNIDAIKEIVRQVRLRDLGGIIVIDFIDMDERKNRQKVMQALEEAMKADRAPSKVLAFNDFGLVAITRKRVKQSLERTLGEPCPYCTGTGLVKSMNTMCNEIYVEMRKMAPHLTSQDIILRVNPEVGKALKANGGRWIQEMEELIRRTILVKPDPLLHQENFDIQG